MVHAFNLSTREVEAGRSLRVQGQPDIQSEFQDSLGHIEKRCLKKRKIRKSEASDEPAYI